MIKRIVAVSVLALMRITYAENRLIPIMRGVPLYSTPFNLLSKTQNRKERKL